MTPDVVADIGNSRMKWGRVADGRIAEVASLPPSNPDAWSQQLQVWKLTSPLRWAMASVNPTTANAFRQWVAAIGGDVLQFSDYRTLPLQIDVAEPDKVGVDRLLSAIGAIARVEIGQPVIVVNAGTAVTVDLIDERSVFRGGAILPGPWLMARSLNDYTAQLPLLEIHEVPSIDPPGRDTRSAIIAGIMAALMGGCQMLVDEYAALCTRPPVVLMTGGAVGYLIDYDFAPNMGVGGPYPLTLDGIRIAAEALP